jgi:hypothetical protein
MTHRFHGTASVEQPRPDERRPYRRPKLVRLGDVRSQVLGPTIGVADSPANGSPRL